MESEDEDGDGGGAEALTVRSDAMGDSTGGELRADAGDFNTGTTGAVGLLFFLGGAGFNNTA